MRPSNPKATRKRFRTVVERAIERAEREAADTLARLVPNTPARLRHEAARAAGPPETADLCYLPGASTLAFRVGARGR